MRKFIRHPADIPLECALEGGGSLSSERLRNVSFGGLCFRCDRPMQPGARLHVRIPVRQPPLDVDGVVAWCGARGEGYEVGVAFGDRASEFSVRMVEQICHIEQYRLDMARNQGRRISGDQAAREWIERHASTFPGASGGG